MVAVSTCNPGGNASQYYHLHQKPLGIVFRWRIPPTHTPPTTFPYDSHPLSSLMSTVTTAALVWLAVLCSLDPCRRERRQPFWHREGHGNHCHRQAPGRRATLLLQHDRGGDRRHQHGNHPGKGSGGNQVNLVPIKYQVLFIVHTMQERYWLLNTVLYSVLY